MKGTVGNESVGFGKAQITPKGGQIVIAGSIPVRYTDVVNDDVYAVAMVLEQNDVRTIWVSCDMCHPTKRLTDDVIQSLRECVPNFKDEELVLSTTHATACFYLTDDEFLNSAFDVDDNLIMSVDETRRQVCEGIVLAIREAFSVMENCTVEFSTAEILTGFCRRVVYKDGSAVMYGNVNRDDFLRMEYPDSGGMQMLYFYRRRDRMLLGIFAAVPCPAQADESSVYITSDYWGAVRERIENEFGRNVNVLGLCRSAGELSPHRLWSVDAAKVTEEWGRKTAEKVGKNIADAIIREMVNPHFIFDTDEIVCSRITKELSFPVRKPSPKEAEEAIEYLANSSNFDEKGEAIDWQAEAKAKHTLKVINEDDFYGAKISVLRIGKLLFFTAPFELFTEYAKKIVVRFPENPVVDIQLTNDSLGYLPTNEAIEHGGYSTCIFSTVTTPEGGEKYVSEVIELLRQL